MKLPAGESLAPHIRKFSLPETNLFILLIKVLAHMISQTEYSKMSEDIFHIINSNRRISDVDTSFNKDALYSLHSQIVVRSLKQTSVYGIRDMVFARVQSGETLLAIASEMHISSYKLAKVYLDAMYSALPMSKIVQNPAIIQNERLRWDILNCIANDSICSHESSQIQECMGREYEELLISMLNRMKMCFETEADLRLRGKPKTPDILFLIPMATVVSYMGTEPFVVNWIDSKAMFADVETYDEHVEQFKGYTNRYGRGLVIYWHGFHEHILQLTDESICVVDQCPTVWIYPTGEIAKLDDNSLPANRTVADA